MKKISVLVLMMIVSVCGLFAQQAPKYNWFEEGGLEVIEYGCVSKKDNPNPIPEDYFLIPIESEISFDEGWHHRVYSIYSDNVLEAWDNFRCLFDYSFLSTSEFFFEYKGRNGNGIFISMYWLDWEHGLAHLWRYYDFDF